MAHDVPVTGPVLAYYGTSRLWKDDSTRASSSGPLVRSDAYDRCLTSHSAFKQLAFWMQKESAADLQLAERGESHRSNALQAVTAVCDTVLSPSLWGQVRYDWRLGTITAEHPTLGLMPVRQLSDGVRSMLALAADVAFRCFLLNPHLGANAASESPGIVLIDEIDLHLHPEWQFEVLPCLRNAFPRVQFIVSTHSPQVLASIEGRCLRNLEETATNSGSCGVAVAGRLDVTTLGRPSYSLMEELQGVKPRPQNAVTERLSRYLQLVRTTSSESAEARVLRKELERDLGPEDPALNQARVRLQVPPGD